MPTAVVRRTMPALATAYSGEAYAVVSTPAIEETWTMAPPSTMTGCASCSRRIGAIRLRSRTPSQSAGSDIGK